MGHSSSAMPVRLQELQLTGTRALGTGIQRFFVDGRISILFFAFALARLSARFSLRDLPAFLDKCCRGDLSAMVAPWLGAWLAPQARQYAFWDVDDSGAQLYGARHSTWNASLMSGRLMNVRESGF
jgi:hypothetical protein